MLDRGEALLSGEVLGQTGTATMLDMNPVSPPPMPNRSFGLGATGYYLESTCNPDDAERAALPAVDAAAGAHNWCITARAERRSSTTPTPTIPHTNS